METEKLKFKVGLSSTGTDKHPHFRISINEEEKILASLESNDVSYYEFDAEVAEGEYNLNIELLNKGNADTVIDEQGNILSDLVLNIESVEIDEIELSTLKWTHSEYRPIYPVKHVASVYKQTGEHPAETVKNCVNLGWNGKWTLPFQSPFYVWLLENM